MLKKALQIVFVLLVVTMFVVPFTAWSEPPSNMSKSYGSGGWMCEQCNSGDSWWCAACFGWEHPSYYNSIWYCLK